MAWPRSAIYVDHGLTGTRELPGLHEALAACRAGTRDPRGLLDGDRAGGQGRLGLRSVAASRTTDEPLPPIETIGDVVEALRLLEVGVGVANHKQ